MFNDNSNEKIFNKIEKEVQHIKKYVGIYDFFYYVRDRIYSHGECDGNFKKAISEIKEIYDVFITNFDITSTDDDGNNILHLIAKNGIYELYDFIKLHPNFDIIKNKSNNAGFTPYDISKSYPYLLEIAINSLKIFTGNMCIPFFVTYKYYITASYKTTQAMKNDNLIYNFEFDGIGKCILNYWNNKMFFEKLSKMVLSIYESNHDNQIDADNMDDLKIKLHKSIDSVKSAMLNIHADLFDNDKYYTIFVGDPYDLILNCKLLKMLSIEHTKKINYDSLILSSDSDRDSDGDDTYNDSNDD